MYLFLQVQFPLSLVSIEFKHFIIFGCGKAIVGLISSFINYFYFTGVPVINIAIRIGLRVYTYHPRSNDDVIKNCPFFETNGVDFYICEVPILFILICNTFFLIWIMVVSTLERYFCSIFYFQILVSKLWERRLPWTRIRNTGKQQRCEISSFQS